MTSTRSLAFTTTLILKFWMSSTLADNGNEYVILPEPICRSQDMVIQNIGRVSERVQVSVTVIDVTDKANPTCYVDSWYDADDPSAALLPLSSYDRQRVVDARSKSWIMNSATLAVWREPMWRSYHCASESC